MEFRVAAKSWPASCLAGVALALALFAPVALYLQWALPGDGPYEYLVTALSLPLVVLSAALVLLRMIPCMARRLAITTCLCLFILVQVWVYVPQLSRRVGQWKELRTMLVHKSEEIEEALRQWGVSETRPLSRAELALLEERLFTPRPRFDFDLPPRAVTLRILSAVPPYVGVDYGEGRNCTFNLDSMVATYCD
jgi:hypothetical protein